MAARIMDFAPKTEIQTITKQCSTTTSFGESCHRETSLLGLPAEATEKGPEAVPGTSLSNGRAQTTIQRVREGVFGLIDAFGRAEQSLPRIQIGPISASSTKFLDVRCYIPPLGRRSFKAGSWPLITFASMCVSEDAPQGLHHFVR